MAPYLDAAAATGRSQAVLGLAICAFACAVALHGNGFIAAFTGGLAYGAVGGQRGARLVPFVEETGALVSLLVWLAFGAVAVAAALESLTWQVVVYAVLSLTVIRMAPTAAALAGARLGRAAVILVGWFGPRGLASVVFALLALEELGQRAAGQAVAVITSPCCSASWRTGRPPIRWPSGSDRGSPRPRAALNTPSCLMYPSAGSSAGHRPQRQGPARTRPARTGDRPASGSGRLTSH
jgi:hypothetical protein